LQAGKVDRSELSPALSLLYPPQLLAKTARSLPAGPPATFAQRSKVDQGGISTYVFRLTWDRGTVDYAFGFDDTTFAIVKLFTRPGPPSPA
jgi:hypothetical protein